MRTRTITTVFSRPSGSYRHKRWDNVPPPSKDTNTLLENILNSTPAWSDPLYNSVQTIVDEVNDKRMQKYCKHTVRRFEVWGNDPPNSYRAFDAPSGNPFLNEKTITGDYLGYSYMRARMAFLDPPMAFQAFDWVKWSFDALKIMRPKFSDLSLVNDLLELHELRNICKPFGAFRRPGSLRDLLRQGSNSVLWNAFGIKPLSNSITGVIRLMKSLETSIRKLRERGKRLQTRHYERPMDIASTSLPADSVIYTENPGDYRKLTLTRRCRWIDASVYHATLKFRYDISRLTDMQLVTRAWIEASGLNRPLSVVWNYIPFSFVVDWFTNVGDWAESLLQEPAIPIVIEDFSHSVKYSYQTEIEISDWNGKYVAPLAKSYISYYERKRDNPATVAPLRFNWADGNQIFLGSALVVQSQAPSSKRGRGAGKLLAYLRWPRGTPTR